MGSHGHGRRPFCSSCSKPSRLCLCNRFKNPPIDNSIPITILQHGHEKNHALNSTRIALLGLKNVVVAPVSDVHFQAQFVIRSMRNDSNCSSRSGACRILDLGLTGAESGTCKVGFDLGKWNLNERFDLKSGSGTSAVGSGLENLILRHGNNAENISSDCIVDSLKTQKEIAELGSESSGVVSDLENQSSGEPPENDGFKWVLDSLEAQKVVGKSTAVFAGESGIAFCKTRKDDRGSDEEKPNNNCSFDANNSLGSGGKDQVNPDFDEVPGSKTENGFLVAGLENGNFQKYLKSFQTHECKQEFEKIPVPPTGKKDIDLQSSQKHLNKLSSEGNHDSLEEGKMVPESDPLSAMVAASEKCSLMNGPTHENDSQKHSHELDSYRMPAPLPSNDLVSATASQSVITCMPEQSSGSLEFDQLGGSPRDKEIIITATIVGRGYISGNPFPEFDQLSASPIGKDFISKGFVVKKLQRKQLGDNMEVEEFEITIPPGSALLFPSKNAISLEAIDFEVKHLIVLDGTWAKARRMYYENPWLKLLPHLKLDPMEMSLYSEVRHQPKAGCLSTIESIVCALKALGDDSVGLDDLLDVFESMVGDQRRCKLERLSEGSLA